MPVVVNVGRSLVKPRLIITFAAFLAAVGTALAIEARPSDPLTLLQKTPKASAELRNRMLLASQDEAGQSWAARHSAASSEAEDEDDDDDGAVPIPGVMPGAAPDTAPDAVPVPLPAPPRDNGLFKDRTPPKVEVQ